MQGDRIAGIGHAVYKARLGDATAGRGKSGGFRIIYYVDSPTKIILLSIYSKSGQTDIDNAEIRRILTEEIS